MSKRSRGERYASYGTRSVPTTLVSFAFVHRNVILMGRQSLAGAAFTLDLSHVVGWEALEP
jgi:hypothetical protein